MKKIAVLALVMSLFVSCANQVEEEEEEEQTLPEVVMTEIRNLTNDDITVKVTNGDGLVQTLVVPPMQLIYDYSVPGTINIIVNGTTMTFYPAMYLVEHRNSIEVVGNAEYGCFSIPVGSGEPYIWTMK